MVKKIKKKKFFDPLNPPETYLMCVVGVRSEDGKADHAITIVNQWIFDANLEKALPLTKASLDVCCSTDDRNSQYVGVVHGWMVVERGGKQET